MWFIEIQNCVMPITVHWEVLQHNVNRICVFLMHNACTTYFISNSLQVKYRKEIHESKNLNARRYAIVHDCTIFDIQKLLNTCIQ